MGRRAGRFDITMSDEPKLTGKQRAFCEHYIACCFNATEAARRAGYSAKSETSLSVEGVRLLRIAKVREYIRERTSEVIMSADEVLLRLQRIAEGSFEPFIYSENHLEGEAPKVDLSTEKARRNIHLLSQIETETTTKITETDAYETVKTKIKLYDAKDALKIIGTYHGLFSDAHKNQQEVEKQIAEFWQTLNDKLPPDDVQRIRDAIAN